MPPSAFRWSLDQATGKDLGAGRRPRRAFTKASAIKKAKIDAGSELRIHTLVLQNEPNLPTAVFGSVSLYLQPFCALAAIVQNAPTFGLSLAGKCPS